jgi:hypothetical protein
MNREKQSKELKELSAPLVEWLYENGNPHSMIVIEMDGVVLYSGEIGIPFEVKD